MKDKYEEVKEKIEALKKTCKDPKAVTFLNQYHNLLTESILLNPKLLDNIAKEVQKKVVGETNKIKAIFLASCGILVKNHQDKTNSNLMVSASSGAGKDFVTRNTLKLWGEEIVVHFTRISPTALDHYDNDWDDKILYLEDMDTRILNSNSFKTFTSSGSSTLITEQKRNVAFKKEIKGKPVVLLTSASATPNKEMLRRFPILPITEDEEHTKKIMARQREFAKTGKIITYDFFLVKALQNLMKVNVVIPFVDKLEGIFPYAHLIMNTHHQRFLSYIQNSAALHQLQRHKDKKGRILASWQDYENARLVLAETTTNVLMIPLNKTQKILLDCAKELDWFSIRDLEIKSHKDNKTVRRHLENTIDEFFEVSEREPEPEKKIYKPTKIFRLKKELMEGRLVLPTSKQILDNKIPNTPNTPFTPITPNTPKLIHYSVKGKSNGSNGSNGHGIKYHALKISEEQVG